MELGGRCKRCGCDDLSILEFHHTEPRTWSCRRVEQSARIARLRQDIAAGVIELMCKPCNLELGEPAPKEEPGPETEAPF